MSFWLKILFCILVADYLVTQPRAAPPASPGTALHVLDCNPLALYKYFPSLRHSWNSGLGFCQVYLRGSHKHVTCCVPKTLEPELPWVPNPRLQLKYSAGFLFLLRLHQLMCYLWFIPFNYCFHPLFNIFLAKTIQTKTKYNHATSMSSPHPAWHLGRSPMGSAL